jgi:CheY-like chemotaxis protein
MQDASPETAAVLPRSEHLLFAHPTGPDRDLYVWALRKSGLEITVEDSAATASGRLSSGTSPDLVLIELLPDPGAAWTLIEQQRARAGDAPIIVLTSLIRPDRAHRDRAKALQCAAFVAKPCSLSLLVDVVSRVRKGTRGLEISRYDI